MGFELNTVKLPTYFEKVDVNENNDTRFQKMKVYVAHTGVNLNNSIFSKEVLEKMLPTLSYMPILGYINDSENGERDFRGHGEKLSVNDGEINIEYITRAYGFIGRDHDAHFEISGGKEWLVCTGYLWTRFSDAIDLFNESNGFKGQSMEVIDGDGYIDGSGHLVFTDGKFNGLCILGDDVPPAMTGATISMEFSKTDVKSSVQEMLNEFSMFEKGAKLMANKKKTDEEIVKDETKSETVEEKVEPSEEKKNDSEKEGQKPTEDGKVKDEESKEVKDKDDKAENEATTSQDASSDHSEDVEQNESASEEEDNFSFDLEKRRQKVRDALNAKSDENSWLWINSIFDDKVIYSNDGDEKSFMCEYSVNADGSIKLGNPVQVFLEYLTAEEVEKVESERNRVSELEAELKELRKFQAEVETTEKEAVLKEAKYQLTNEKASEIRAAFSTLSKEEVEKEIAYAIYQTNKLNTKQNKVRTVNTAKSEDFGFGTANELFVHR